MGSMERPSENSEFGDRPPFIPPYLQPHRAMGDEQPNDIRPPVEQSAEAHEQVPLADRPTAEIRPRSPRAFAARELVMHRGAAEYKESAAVHRDRLQTRYGAWHDETGIDMPAARTFMQALGVESDAGLLLLSDEHFESFTHVMYANGYLESDDDGPASFQGEIDTAVINRDQFRPDLLGATVVHELAGHGSAQRMGREAIIAAKYVEERYGLPSVPVHGLVNVDIDSGKLSGQVWDEGRAEWIALEYRHAVGEAMENQEQNPQGVKYADARGMYTSAAKMIDILCAEDEGLVETMLQAGQDTEGTQQFMSQVNRIRPGLYAAIADLQLDHTPQATYKDYTTTAHGLSIALEATGRTAADIRSIANHGPAAEYVADKLRAQQADIESGQALHWYPLGRPDRS